MNADEATLALIAANVGVMTVTLLLASLALRSLTRTVRALHERLHTVERLLIESFKRPGRGDG